MKKLTAGIDVSKETLDISLYNGGKHDNITIANDKKSFVKFLKKYSSDDLQIVMEATGIYHLRIALEAHDLGYFVSVVNPLIIKRYGEMKMLRAKTDRVDARLIAEYGYEQSPKEFTPHSDDRMVLFQLLKAIEDLYKTRTEFRNRLESYTHGYPVSKEVGKTYRSMVQKIDREIERLKKKLQDSLDTHFPDQSSKLTSIKGVGKMTASMIMVFYGNFEQFETAKQAVSFAGLNPHPRQSGTSVKRGSSISKRGHALIRKTLYMSALSAKKHNPVYREYYERLLASGKSKKVALVAVAHKLLRHIFAIVKYDREWDPQYAK